MHLLNLTLQPASAATTAVVGSFSGKGQEIIVVRGSTRLEVLKLNPSTGVCEWLVLLDPSWSDERALQCYQE